VLGDSLTDFEREIQPGKPCVVVLELLNNPQRVEVVIESIAEPPHLAIQFSFARVCERRMAEIMCQRKCFGQIFAEPEDPGDCAGNLRHFDRVRQPVAKVVAYPGCKNLRFVFEAPKGTRMYDAVAITSKIVAIRVRLFRETTAFAPLNGKSEMRKRPGDHDTPIIARQAVRSARSEQPG